MQALVLEERGKLRLREIDVEEVLGPTDVRIAIRTVGICGSDVHYYRHGRIGPFVVEEPMILGHEAAGTVVELGEAVTTLEVGDRVCMEPGIPHPGSRESRAGMYNLDPAVRFWATPPVHGCLRSSVVHPADFTFRLPPRVSFAEGAMVEPLAVGVHAAAKANVRPGDVAVIIGAGPIGVLTALSALASGCSHVVISDVEQTRLDLAQSLGRVTGVNVREESLPSTVREITGRWGADLVFEASGNARAAADVFEMLRPGGTVVFVGMPGEPVAYDVVAAQIKEARVENVFRYAHVFERAIALIAGGMIDVEPLITHTFDFRDGPTAFEFAADPPENAMKVQIEL